MIRREIFLRRLDFCGREEEMENEMEVVSQDQESWARKVRICWERAAIYVNVVEERMSIRWAVWGMVEVRRVARHLMYVTDRCVKQPAHESKESF